MLGKDWKRVKLDRPMVIAVVLDSDPRTLRVDILSSNSKDYDKKSLCSMNAFCWHVRSVLRDDLRLVEGNRSSPCRVYVKRFAGSFFFFFLCGLWTGEVTSETNLMSNDGARA